MCKNEKSRNVARILLGAMLALAGTSHLSFAREEFQAQVPDWVPTDKDTTVLLSGVAEISLGLSLIAAPKRYRPTAGAITAAFFAAVFPGNIHQYNKQIDAFGLDTDAKRFTRLFFQPPLILWALWSTRKNKR